MQIAHKDENYLYHEKSKAHRTNTRHKIHLAFHYPARIVETLEGELPSAYFWPTAFKHNNVASLKMKTFLKEKLNRNQFIAVILVVTSLFYFLIKLGELPWIGLTVAITFSIYGLIRKKIKVSSDIGLLIETLLISPIAIALFIYLINLNLNVFSYKEPLLSFYLFWSGFMTLVPLFLYTLGFKIIGIGPASMILFLTPTSQFLLGITYFDEILTFEKFFGFVIIWIAVSIYLNELRKV